MQLDAKSPPLAAAVRIELRKLTDTRASRWLVGVMTLSAFGTLSASMTGTDKPTMGDLISATSLPFLLLCPLVAVLSATQEWQGQTFARTFALVPRRSRVIGAKFVASVALTIGVLAACGVLSVGLVLGLGGHWSTSGVSVTGLVLVGLAYVVQGLAFGLLTRNALIAVSAFLVGPIACTTVLQLLGVEGTEPYLNLRAATQPLTETLALTTREALQLVCAIVVWVALPAALGIRRTVKGDLD